jgi:hypothetical protein
MHMFISDKSDIKQQKRFTRIIELFAYFYIFSDRLFDNKCSTKKEIRLGKK